MKNLFKLSIFLFLGIVLFNSNAFADIPSSIVFQGRLTDNTGAPITASNKTFKFDFYTASTGGSPVFSIPATGVNINNGLYSVMLDLSSVSQANLNQPLFVQVTYDTTNIIGGRTALGSSPYAMTVKDNSISANKIQAGAVTSSKIGNDVMLIPSIASQSGKFLTTDGSAVAWASTPAALPPQAGHIGKYLTTSGTIANWSTLNFSTGLSNTGGTVSVTNPLPAAFPVLATGQYLTNNGSSLSWAAIQALPAGGTNGQYLTFNGTNAVWSTLNFSTGLSNTGGTVSVTNPLPAAFPVLATGQYLTNNGAALSWAAIQALPAGGTNGQYLTFNGTNAVWSTLNFSTGLSNTGGTVSVTNPLPAAFPVLATGQYLTNNGAALSWAAIQALPAGGTNGQYLTFNGTNPAWSTLTFGSGLMNTSGNISVSTPVPTFTAINNGQFLTNDGNATLSWSAIQALPAGGTNGQYLTINASTPAWAQVDSVPASLSTNLIQSGAVFSALSAKQDQIIAGTSGDVLIYTGTVGTLGSLGFDSVPLSASNNLITSGAIYTALEGKVDKNAAFTVGGVQVSTESRGATTALSIGASGAGNEASLVVYGTIYASSTVIQAADLAEIYPSSEMLEPGDVVIISEIRDGYIEKSKSANDTKVAGVISTEPGIVLNSSEKGYKLALVGKVPVKITNEGGNIKRGDLLVASSTPGHAMKATDPKPGTVIGKALENSTGSRGKISALVNLQ